MIRRWALQSTAWCVCIAVPLAAAGAGAKALQVATNGVDSGGCGFPPQPCRSISQAIANAVAGDTISVGPGRYGDLDGDQTFGEPGEEGPQAATCDCLVLVDKAVTILSRAGAAVTVIDGDGTLMLDAVRVSASEVVFGGRNKGFTLTGVRGGVVTAAGTSGAVVAGNVSLANSGTGFLVDGSGHLIEDCRAQANDGIGFLLRGDGGHTARRDVAVRHVDFITGTGFYLQTSGNVLTASVSTGNLLGAVIGGTGNEVSLSSVVGNLGAGIQVNVDGDLALSRSNVYGNELGGNCGLDSNSALAVEATQVFWGDDDGPGADPADAICGNVGMIDASAPAKKEFKIKLKAMR